MLLAVISDTHISRGSRVLPEQCLERLRGADLILHGGDLVTPDVLAELEALGRPVEATWTTTRSAACCPRRGW